MKKIALIVGISGQDGGYLAKLLFEKGYVVHGTSRDVDTASFANLKYLGLFEQVTLHSMAVSDFRSVLQVISDVIPDEIYNLSGQSSVALSFLQPVETHESIVVGTLNLLEVIRFMGRPIKFYNAGSGECFGDTKGFPAKEDTPFRPRSPYAVSKSAAFWQVANYRESYGLFACSGILFNHESPLRPERFVTRKIVSSAYRIAKGSKENLKLGDISVRRDWGWAPEYVEAMWSMMQVERPEDFVIATGEHNSLEDFVRVVFAELNLDWREYVSLEPSLLRPSDISVGVGNPEHAYRTLNWKAQTKMLQVVHKLIEAENCNN